MPLPATILLIAVGAAFLALGTWAMLSDWREHRMPADLRGDWWERFERDFRAYAAGTRNRSRRAGRPPRNSRPPS